MNFERRWPWIAQQTWRNILFIHFPVPYKMLKNYIPPPFTLETYNGQAWIGIVLFEALNSRLRGMPRSLSFRKFLQLNIRTYITFDSEPGVYFFSLDASRKLPVMGAKLFALPYFHAQMQFNTYEHKFRLTSKRMINNRLHFPMFDIKYKPVSEPFMSKNDSLFYWFTERYCIWLINGNKIYKAPISHKSWPLQSAEADIAIDHDFPLLSYCHQATPITHYCLQMNAHVHPFEQKGIYLI